MLVTAVVVKLVKKLAAQNALLVVPLLARKLVI
jgi:hypothetical protein